MSEADFQLHGIRDPRLAVLATSAAPAWVWSLDGARILWANTAGALLFGARNTAILAEKIIGPADPHRRQAAQLAARLSPSGATRLERLRGFGAPLGRLLTCSCARLTFTDGAAGILIAATEMVGRPIPLTERLANLIDSVTMPAIAFTPAGALAGANEHAKSFAGVFNDLTGPGFDDARAAVLRDGQSTLQMDIGRITVHRVGRGQDTALVALIGAAPKQVTKPVPVVVASAIEAAPAVEPVQAVSAAQPTIDVSHDDVSHDEAAPAPSTDAMPADVVPADLFESVFDEPATQETPYEARHETSSTDQVTRVYIGDEQRKPFTETSATDHVPDTPTEMDNPSLPARQQPLRFMWQMDPDGRFSLGSDEFSRLIGTRTAAAFGRLWSDISAALGLDPEGRVAAAVATRETWSGIVVDWPADGDGATLSVERLPVELSGLPIHDGSGHFAGYRGFGICRDIEGMARLAAQRRDDVLHETMPLAAPFEDAAAQDEPAAQDDLQDDLLANTDQQDEPVPSDDAFASDDTFVGSTQDNFPKDNFPKDNFRDANFQDNHFPQTEAKPAVDTPQNVVPFPVTEPKAPALTPVESNAFDELARRLSARLDNGDDSDTSVTDLFADADQEPPKAEHVPEAPAFEHPPAFLQREAPPPRAYSAQDSQLLDWLPVGVLVYRLDRLIYANSAFLSSTGYDSLHTLAEAGGLDALTVEAGAGSASSTSETGTPVVIAATSESGPDKGQPADARLFAITWDGEPAHALIFSGSRSEPRTEPVAPAAIAPVVATSDDTTQAEELATILDTTAEGIVIFDGEGRLMSCNRSAEALFGRTDTEIAALGLTDLFAPESQRAVLDYFESVKTTSVASLLEHGRDMLGRVRDGGIIPLSMTLGRTRPDSARFFAIFRDLSQAKKNESELMQARRQAERASGAKADILGRISHEVRMPLNAIIGFSDVMIEERFGALGNERYVEYMKDIRASGQRVMAIIDDLLDLSRIESGKMELSFASQDLNSMVEQCVAVMQPQANRERIIIRTSLAHALPTIKADARALRQIALNLIGNSIHLANAGGQVIVSTATTDFGDIVLRVRDTGPGLNDNEIAAAMAPFRTQGASDQTADGSVVNLSLTKALVEANRAQFHIKTAPHSGTLIEIVFSHASAIA